MATIKAETSFPTEVVQEMFNAVKGHSALGKLSDEKPIPFNGTTEFTFSAAGEAQLVGEGGQKNPGNAAVTPVVIKPQKFVYQQRVSDEFINASDEVRLDYLRAFADGFARKIARGFDIAAIHGLEPSTLTDASFKATNSFDGLVTPETIASGTAVDEAIEQAIASVTDGEVNGLALSPEMATDLAALKVNGVPQYPEYRFGGNPATFYGMRSDVNSTVSTAKSGATPDAAIVGDFENAFRWGYAKNIPLDVIRYGDPDGTGKDLKQYNEVCLRAEAYIGWGILDANAFAIVPAQAQHRHKE